MQTVRDIRSLRNAVLAWKRQGQSIAFVPTMGNLHEGHLALVRQAHNRCDRVITSIFVNPMQFDRMDEVARYPRTEEADGRRLAELGCDLLFLPEAETVYPRGSECATHVELPKLTETLCGAHRPGHFRGVTTVVCKLFNMVQPDVAVFGEKDFQQLTVIRHMTKDLNLPIEVVGVATVREPDGLAMSSRNLYLTAEQRACAPILYSTLTEVAQQLLGGNKAYRELEADAFDSLRKEGFKPEYIAIRRIQDLAEPNDSNPRELVVLAAAWLGEARLIDNIQLTRLDRGKG